MAVSSLSFGYIRLLKQSVYVKCAQKDGLFLPEIVYSNSHLCIIGLKWVVPLEALW